MHKINYSIVIPTYNSSMFIEKLLKSIPKREDLEAIIVDDYSKDFNKLKKIVVGYKFVKLMQNTKSRGAGSARQAGLENASGKWVLFADSDDGFTVNFNEVLDQSINQAADIILCIPRAERLDGSRSDRCDYYHYLFNQYINGKISNLELSYRLTNVWSKIYRREAIANASFEDTLVADDVQFAAQAAFYTRKRIVVDKHHPIYVLTERAGSITSTRHKKLSKYLTRAKIRMINDGWIKTQLKRVGEAPIRIRRYESLLRIFLLTAKYNEEKRARWTFNPIRTVLRLGSIIEKAIFAVTVKSFLYKINKPIPLRLSEVHVAYCVDANVVEQSLISLVSVLKNNDVKLLNAHYIFTELPSRDMQNIKALERRYSNLNITFHKVSAKRLEGLFSRKYTKITPIGYGRFLFAEILPNIKKVLYMDTDVVCVGDISGLWKLKIDNNFAAAVPEYPSWYSTGLTKNQEKARLFIARKNEMINSGVMLFNLDYMRENKIVDTLFKTDKLIVNRMNQDQDIYDVVFEGRMRILPVVYNMTATTYTQNLTKIFDAVFIHYTGPNKPWNEKSGMKKVMALLDLRLPYYKKYEKILKNET